MEIHFSYVLGTAWISASSKKFRKPLTLKCLCFEMFEPYIFFISLTMGIQFSNILGVAWINASHEMCQKLIALEGLCFPIRFLYYENSVFPCFWNCVAFSFTRNRGVRNM